MDVLKQKLNDIGACIGYPFYFFEDGSFSSIFVNGKMNASLVVKGAFAKSDKCFFASAEIAKLSEVKALEKGWTQKSMMPNTVNWFKKYLNDIGTAINYPFYVFDNGAYAKASSLGDKEAVLYVKKPFTSVEGELSFFSSDAQKVLQFNEDLKKVQQRRETQKTELQQIVFRMLAHQRVSDDEMLLVIEAGKFDVFSAYAEKYKCSNSGEMYARYPKSFMMLAKMGRWDILEMFGCWSLYEFPYLALKELYYKAPLETLNYFWNAEMKCLAQVGCPQCLIERGDTEIYCAYRLYVSTKMPGTVYKDFEFSAILQFDAVDMLGVLLTFSDLIPEDQGKLVEYGNVEMIHTYIRKKGLNEHFRQLLLYSGRDELVELANNPKKVLRENSQKKVVTVAQGETETGEFSGWLQKVKKFFGISA